MQQNTKSQQPLPAKFSAQQLASMTPSERSLAETDTLFLRMMGIYSQLWIDHFPTEEAYKIARHEWSLQIAKLSPFQIEQGVQGCISSGEKYPPTLPVFIKHALTTPEQSRARKIYK